MPSRLENVGAASSERRYLCGLGSRLHIGDRIGFAVMKVSRDVVRRLLEHREFISRRFVHRFSVPFDRLRQGISDSRLTDMRDSQEQQEKGQRST